MTGWRSSTGSTSSGSTSATACAAGAHRRRRPAGRPAARASAHAHHLAPGGAAAGRGRPHRRLPRPARLRAVVEAADDRGPRAVLEARDGRRRRRADAPRSGTSGSPSSGTTGAATWRCGRRWTTRTPSRTWRCSTASRSPRRLDRTDARFAAAWWHWFFFAPDRQARAGDQRRPGRLVRPLAPGKVEAMGEENHADHLAAINDPGHRAGDARGLPGRPGRGPRGRRGRPGGGSADAPARRWCCGRAATTSRSCSATRWPIWADWTDGPARRRTDRQRPPHGRGGARRSWPQRCRPSSGCDHLRAPGQRPVHDPRRSGHAEDHEERQRQAVRAAQHAAALAQEGAAHLRQGARLRRRTSTATRSAPTRWRGPR